MTDTEKGYQLCLTEYIWLHRGSISLSVSPKWTSRITCIDKQLNWDIRSRQQKWSSTSSLNNRRFFSFQIPCIWNKYKTNCVCNSCSNYYGKKPISYIIQLLPSFFFPLQYRIAIILSDPIIIFYFPISSAAETSEQTYHLLPCTSYMLSHWM